MKRRETLKLLSALPLVAVAPAVVLAGDKKSAAKLNLIDPSAGMPKAMQYVHDASKAPGRSDKKANCGNCNKYNICNAADPKCKPLDKKAVKTAKAAPCQLFAGGNVAKAGWCAGWAGN